MREQDRADLSAFFDDEPAKDWASNDARNMDPRIGKIKPCGKKWTFDDA